MENLLVKFRYIVDLVGKNYSKRGFIFLAKVFVTLVFFYLIFRKINFSSLKEILLNMNGIWLLVSVVIISAQVPLVGMRWQKIILFLVSGAVRVISQEIQAVNASAIFMGQILPSPAADALRFYWLHKMGFSLTQAGLSILIDRLVALYVYLLMSVVILYCLCRGEDFSGFRSLFLTLIFMLLGFGIFFPYFSRKLGMKLIKFPGFVQMAHALTEMRALILSRAGVFLLSFCFLVNSMTILSIYFLGLSLHMHLSIMSAAMLMVCMVMATLAPISIGGWGFREFATISLAKIMPGLSIESATAISLLFGGVTLISALLPLIYWWRKNPIKTFLMSQNYLSIK